MAPETMNMLPAVLLGIMVALTLFLLPHLNDETPHRRDEGDGRDAMGDRTSISTIAGEQGHGERH